MAKLFGEIAAKSILTLDKSFARANGQPLDSSEIYYSLTAAQDYAKTDIAYIGQKIVVVENGKVTHYSIEDAAGTLKEVGSKPVGDTKTIKVATDGTVSLANIPETQKDEEGNDIPATYNAVLVNGVLTWVKPSETTVEGLSTLIEALTKRVDTAEADIDKLETAVGTAYVPETTPGAGDAKEATGLYKAIEDEGQKIFTWVTEDNENLIEARPNLEDGTSELTATGYVGINGSTVVNFTHDKKLGSNFEGTAATATAVEGTAFEIKVPKLEVNEYGHVISASDETYTLTLPSSTNIVATANGYTDEQITGLELSIAKKTIGEGEEATEKECIIIKNKAGEEVAYTDATMFVQDSFLDDVVYEEGKIKFTWRMGDGSTKTDEVDVADFVQTYTAGNGLNLEGNEFSVKLASDTETFLSVDANGLKLSGVQTAIESAASGAVTEAVGQATTLAGTAKSEAIAAAAEDATGKADAALASAKTYAEEQATAAKEAAIAEDITYALSGNGVTVTLTPSKGEATPVTLDAYTKSETDNKIDEKIASVTGGESAADVKLALESYRDALNKEVWGDDAGSWTTSTTVDGKTVVTYTPNYGATSRIDTLATETLVDVVKANDNVKLALTKDTATRTVKVDDSALVSLITAAQNKADKAEGDAATAQTTANDALAAANNNGTALGTLTTTVNGHTTTIGEHTTKIANLETFQNEHTALYNSLKSTVDGHVTAIAGKAEQTALNDAVARIAANETAIKTLNETTIPAINAAINDKVDKTTLGNYYTKEQIGAITEGSTIVKMIEDAQKAATYDDTKVKADIAANTAALVILNSDATVTGSVAKTADDRIAAALAGADADFDTLKEMSDWLSTHKGSAAEMNSAITANTNAITGINGVLAGFGGTDEPATVKGYVDAQIVAIPNATLVTGEDETVTATKGLITPEADKFEMTDGKVTAISTDLLIQGSATLILNGGTAAN